MVRAPAGGLDLELAWTLRSLKGGSLEEDNYDNTAKTLTLTQTAYC